MAIAISFRTLAKIETIELDASVSEQHNSEVKVTEYPVEQGTNVADHAQVMPETLTVEGIISNTPIKAGVVLQTGQLRADDAYTKLIALRDARKLVTVSTKLHSYADMMLTSLNIPKDAKTGHVLRFSATFKQVRQVQTQRVTLPAKRKTRPGKKNLGNQVAQKTAEPVKDAVNRSALKQGAMDLMKLVKGGR